MLSIFMAAELISANGMGISALLLLSLWLLQYTTAVCCCCLCCLLCAAAAFTLTPHTSHTPHSSRAYPVRITAFVQATTTRDPRSEMALVSGDVARRPSTAGIRAAWLSIVADLSKQTETFGS